MKKWLRNLIFIISIVAALFTIFNSFYGWVTPEKEIKIEYPKPTYICADGTLASTPEECPRCYEDNICKKTEDCTCKDCKNQVNCIIQRIKEKEYLLILNTPKKLYGKTVTAKEITPKGVVIIEIDGIAEEIKTTKQETMINGLKITTQEIIYSYISPKDSMVIIKAEPASENL